jgi:pimeloyl-ACP methyl ester carboxylesterase
VAVAIALLVLTACGGHTGTTSASNRSARAVVIVSGLASTSPFTTPDAGCAVGLAAGSADTALRDHLTGTGHTVYTAPAMAGRGQVTDQTGFGAFGACPITLPENMTIDTSGSIDLAGEHLARFLTYLHSDKGVDEINLVGHSMGGLYARAAIRALATNGSPLKVRSLITIGTPWQGSYLADYANHSVPLSDCLGDKFCESQMTGFVKDVADVYMSGSAHELGQAYLSGAKGWNQFQAGVLDHISVTVIGGNRFAKPGAANPMVWPNDGIVAQRSALAVDIDASVLPHRRCFMFDDTHSDYVSMIADLPKDTALTIDSRVLDAVASAIDDASVPDGRGCPGL